MLIGYARVSTDDQNLDLQNDALKQAGCDKIIEEKASGAKTDRAGLDEALSFLRKGDTLVVWKLDRLGRWHFYSNKLHRGIGVWKLGAVGKYHAPLKFSRKYHI